MNPDDYDEFLGLAPDRLGLKLHTWNEVADYQREHPWEWVLVAREMWSPEITRFRKGTTAFPYSDFLFTGVRYHNQKAAMVFAKYVGIPPKGMLESVYGMEFK